jgi:uncharacterized protein
VSEPPTARAQVHRHPERAAYDHATIDAILDEALICHVAWVDDRGGPRALPTIHARVGDTLYVHGSRGGRPWKAIRSGVEICVVATIVDAIVLARSAFSSSMNYRSAVVYGTAREVLASDELRLAAKAITSHVLPGREVEARMPTEDEFNQTLMLALPIEEASAKVRTGPPVDAEDDLDLPIWAGTLPLRVTAGRPEPDPRARHRVQVPAYVAVPRRPALPHLLD